MNIYLIGYRGSGKTTVGRLLAAELDREWHDSDAEIELLTGMSISQIFATQGEAGFRDWEQSIVSGLATKQNIVVSLGGGAVLELANRKAIRDSGKTIWLQAPADELWSRIEADEANDRPALSDRQGIEEVRFILEQRNDVYNECADYVCITKQRTPEQISDEIAKWWRTADT